TAFKDEYNDALIRLIAAKTSGQPIIAPVATPAQLAAPDLADLLIKSLNMKGADPVPQPIEEPATIAAEPVVKAARRKR
ncbi:MAG: hypothetical protein PHX05_09930, partial [Acidobacteriota bacterium]|nr:hypothetical protein [Acidobacteriota bacterium]